MSRVSVPYDIALPYPRGPGQDSEGGSPNRPLSPLEGGSRGLDPQPHNSPANLTSIPLRRCYRRSVFEQMFDKRLANRDVGLRVSEASGRATRYSVRAVSKQGVSPASLRLVECDGKPLAVAAMIRETRDRLGLTQEQLAQRAGCTQTMITRWEKGEHAITLKSLSRLADAFGCGLTVRFFAAGSEE